MILSSILSTGLLAYTANAFLVPLEIADKVQLSGPPKSPSAPSGSLDVAVDCSSCPFAIDSFQNGHHEWKNGIKNDLSLTFEAHGNELLVNGQPIYPVDPRALPSPITIKQSPSSHEPEIEAYKGDLELSYSVAFGPEKKGETGLSLVELTLTLLGLDGKMITVDDLEIILIKTSEGEVSDALPSTASGKSEVRSNTSQLSIARIDNIAPSPSDPSAKCHTMLCRAMTKFLTKVAAARQSAAHAAAKAAHKMRCFCVRCMHRMAHLFGHKHNDQSGQSGLRLPTHHKIRPGDLLEKVPKRTHSVMHKIMHGFKAFAKLFLLPTFIGAAVGFTASAIGMAVGQLIVILWTKFRRGGNHAYERVETDEKDELPPYEEVSIIEVLNEKEGADKV